jgi:hypothetical protein
VFGVAFCVTVLHDQSDLGQEPTNVRARVVDDYGGPTLHWRHSPDQRAKTPAQPTMPTFAILGVLII